MPSHYLNLPGAAALETPQLELVRRDVAALVDHRALGVVHGPAGLGKTFAVQAALEHLTSRRQARTLPRIVSLVFTHAPTTLSVVGDLASALLPERPRRATRFTLQHLILAELARAEHLLVVDEAQRLTQHAMEVLRYCFDDSTARLALLLVGGNGCWEVISREPMLVSRVLRRRGFTPLPPARVPALMAAYHPLYAHAEPELLAEVDAGYAHGNWRAWAAFTLTAAEIAEQAGRDTLDAEIAANTYVSLGYGDAA